MIYNYYLLFFKLFIINKKNIIKLKFIKKLITLINYFYNNLFVVEK